MFLHIVPIYAAILAFMYAALTIYVIVGRNVHHVLLGNGGNEDMARRARMHGNFIEYVPFILLLLMIAEFRGAPAEWLHGFAGLLVVGRIAHAYAIARGVPALKFRAGGMIATLISLIGSGILILCL